MNDIFEKIINRELPAHIVYEDDLVLAFLTIEPVNKGHTLVIPKKKFVNIFDGEPETLAHMMKVAQKVGKVLVSDLEADGVNLIMNNGEHAGQEVWHAHLHVVPRLINDNAFQKPKHIECSNEELVDIKTKIAEKLN